MHSQKKFSLAIFVPLATGVIGLLVFAWQGTFARLLADDYYHFYLIDSHANLFGSIAEKYTYANNRYSTLFFFQLAEWLGGVQWLPALMIVLWVFSIYWLLRSALNLAAKPALASAVLIAFFSLLQAPNRYQSIYWLSSSVTHFFPLPLYTLLLAWIFKIANAKKLTGLKDLSGFAIPIFILSYFIGGLSESSAALNFTVMVILAFLLWLGSLSNDGTSPFLAFPRGGKGQILPPSGGDVRRTEGGTLHKIPKNKNIYLFLALSALANLAALLTMALSPANAMRTDGTPLPLTDFLFRLLKYPLEFMLNTVKTLPFPTIATFALGFLIFGSAREKRPKPKSLIILLLVTPFLTHLFIAASFAPNAYVFSFPDARVLFPARFLLTAALFAEGAFAGMLLVREKLKPFAAVLLVVVALYPLRGAWNTVLSTENFRHHAQAWDTRDAYIRAQRDAGETDIIVPTVNGVAGIKELDISARHWVNQGAAAYYGVESISVDTTRFNYDE